MFYLAGTVINPKLHGNFFNNYRTLITVRSPPYDRFTKFDDDDDLCNAIMYDF